MTDKEYKIFKRYLKERGLYSEFFRQATEHNYRIAHRPIREYLSHHTPAGEEIMRLISWNMAKWDFWSYEYRNYRKFLEKILIDIKLNNDNIYEHFAKVKKINVKEESV